MCEMKILRKINTIPLFLCLIVGDKLYSQEANGFYLTKDTIKISDPIIISVKGKAGKIITSSQEYNRSSNIEKLLNDNKAFLYFDDYINHNSLYICWFHGICVFYNNQCENQNTTLLWDNNRRSYFLFINVYFFIQAKIQEDYNG